MGDFEVLCQSCRRTLPSDAFNTFCPCGGMADVCYNLRRAQVGRESNPLLRFFDLLPIKDPDSVRWLGDGNTPTLHATRLGKVLGLDNLYLKDETKNPTLTTKDRMASMVLSYFHELGIREFACSSTGNSSTSFVHGVERFDEFTVHVFVGRDFLHRMNFDSSTRVKVYWLRDTDFAGAHAYAASFAERTPGITGESGFFNPARREGLKMAFLEAALEMPEAPQWYFQGVSSGMGVYGTWRGAQQLHALGLLQRLPRLACVQQETCAPMVKSWEAGSSTVRPQDIVHNPVGIAEAILRGNPSRAYPHLSQLVRESGGTMKMVSEERILEAQRMLFEQEGIEACPAASTTIAAIRGMSVAGELRRDDFVLANVTGGVRGTGTTPRTYTMVGNA